jgi:hypothetical protein
MIRLSFMLISAIANSVAVTSSRETSSFGSGSVPREPACTIRRAQDAVAAMVEVGETAAPARILGRA